MGRTAVAILSTDNLVHNLTVLRDKVRPAKLIAMVKANAYGHGIRSVSSRIEKHADMLGVASIDEALALRKVGVNTTIMLAEGVFEASELLIASTEKFHVVFHNEAQVEWLAKSSLPLPLKSWIKVNTGMGRLGFSPEDAARHYVQLHNNSQVEKPVRILSHFACADEQDHPLNAQQIQCFQELIKTTEQKTHPNIPAEYSLNNSAGIIHFPHCHYDYVRPGIALYGVSPIVGQTAESLGLKPVMTLQSSLISVQQVPKGASIGYGGRYCCPEDMLIGVVAFGYGDGYPITAQDGAPVLINNVECPLVGRVSMDMMNVDLRKCPNARVGDPVILWGQGLPIEKVAEHTSNIPYDMLTGVQSRVKFLWTRS